MYSIYRSLVVSLVYIRRRHMCMALGVWRQTILGVTDFRNLRNSQIFLTALRYSITINMRHFYWTDRQLFKISPSEQRHSLLSKWLFSSQLASLYILSYLQRMYNMYLNPKWRAARFRFFEIAIETTNFIRLETSLTEYANVGNYVVVCRATTAASGPTRFRIRHSPGRDWTES